MHTHYTLGGRGAIAPPPNFHDWVTPTFSLCMLCLTKMDDFTCVYGLFLSQN